MDLSLIIGCGITARRIAGDLALRAGRGLAEIGKRRAFDFVLWVLTLVALVAAAQAFAHDRARPDLDGWYQSLRSGKGPCCDGPGADALHLRDADWETKGGHYRVRVPVDGVAFGRAMRGEEVDTVWVDVSDDAVVATKNEDGTTLVWPIYGYMGPSIRCFVPGTMS